MFDPAPGERLIHLTRGYDAIINEDDWPLVSPYTWRVQIDQTTCYAVSQTPRIAGKRQKLYMHRLITQAPEKGVVDHWDWCGLNNRRNNLRVCGFTDNAQNVHDKCKASAAGFRGVCKVGQRYRARISWAGEETHLGMFDTALEAAHAYDAAALNLYGPYAWRNFNRPPTLDPTPVYKIEEVPF